MPLFLRELDACESILAQLGDSDHGSESVHALEIINIDFIIHGARSSEAEVFSS